MVGKAIYSRLASDGTVSGLVGTRIRPAMLRQEDALPALVYNVIANVHVNHVSGLAGLSHARIQVDCWAASHSAAETLAAAVRARLDGWSGSSGGVSVTGSLIIEDNYGDALSLMDDDTMRGRITIDISVWYRE